MYIVLEIQKNGDGTVGNLVYTYEDKNEAGSKYHSVLASAAVSILPVHTAFLLTDDGFKVESKCYRHGEEEK